MLSCLVSHLSYKLLAISSKTEAGGQTHNTRHPVSVFVASDVLAYMNRENSYPLPILDIMTDVKTLPFERIYCLSTPRIETRLRSLCVDCSSSIVLSLDGHIYDGCSNQGVIPSPRDTLGMPLYSLSPTNQQHCQNYLSLLLRCCVR